MDTKKKKQQNRKGTEDGKNETANDAGTADRLSSGSRAESDRLDSV